MASYLIMWGVFTGVLFMGALKLNRVLQVVFGLLTLLFFLLAIGDITESAVIKHIAGFEGVLCGLSAVSAGVSQVLNEVYGRNIWPIDSKK